MQGNKVMVCVTRQKNCERLIHQGALFAQANNMELLVVHAVRPNDAIMGSLDEARALDYLFSVCRDYNATMTMIRNADTLEALVKFAGDNSVGMMIMGASPQRVNSIVDRIKSRLPAMSFLVVESTIDITQEPVA